MKIKRIMLIIVFMLIMFFTNTVYGFTLVIDPGHGGIDSGAIASNGNQEKDMNLKIAQYLKDYLSKYDLNIYLTHEGYADTYDIFDRAIFARSKNPDLLISIHLNSSETAEYPNGAEVYVTSDTSLPKYNKQTTELGNKILANLGALGINNRGVRTRLCTGDPTDIYSDGTRSDYYGIIRYAMRGTKIDYGVRYPADAKDANVQNGEGVPAMIVEHCYLKGSDIQFIDTDEKLKKLAEADGKAIVEYYGLSLKKKKDPNTPFEDVYVDDWYTSAVEYVYKNNIIKGYNNTTFAPEDKLTRGMIATILYRMAGSPDNDGVSRFSDVNSEEYYAKAVKWAVDVGIVHGYENTDRFGPDDYILRQDLAGMLRNYANYKEEDTSATMDLSKYSDYQNIADYASGAMQWAVEKGVITGNANGTLAPNGNATRAEASAMIQKYCQKVGR